MPSEFVFQSKIRAAPYNGAVLLFCAALAVSVSAGTCGAKDTALQQLLAENCQLADAIVKGRIVSSDTPPNELTRTRFAVTVSVRGPMKAGEVIEYFSFMEPGARSGPEFQNEMVVFLTSKKRDGETLWGLATDFSEFASFRLTGRTLHRCMRSRKKEA